MYDENSLVFSFEKSASVMYFFLSMIVSIFFQQVLFKGFKDEKQFDRKSSTERLLQSIKLKHSMLLIKFFRSSSLWRFEKCIATICVGILMYFWFKKYIIEHFASYIWWKSLIQFVLYLSIYHSLEFSTPSMWESINF